MSSVSAWERPSLNHHDKHKVPHKFHEDRIVFYLPYYCLITNTIPGLLQMLSKYYLDCIYSFNHYLFIYWLWIYYSPATMHWNFLWTLWGSVTSQAESLAQGHYTTIRWQMLDWTQAYLRLKKLCPCYSTVSWPASRKDLEKLMTSWDGSLLNLSLLHQPW